MTEQRAPAVEPALSFDRFQILPHQRLLLEAGRPVRIGSRALDILLALLERPGETDEDGQAAKDRLLRWAQQVVAPVQRRAHGPVPWEGRASAPGEQAQPVVELRRQPADTKHADTRGRELDRQGYAGARAAPRGIWRNVRP